MSGSDPGPAAPAAALQSLASDNCSGAHPAVIEAITAANRGYFASYGSDPVSEAAGELVRGEFGPEAQLYSMANGTGANVTALRLLARPHQAVICAGTAHVAIDEGAAPEAIAGIKLLPVATPDGKLTPELAATRLADPADVPHAAWPAAITIAQATEVGTVYSPDEVRDLAAFAAAEGLALHMDGARLANAAAALGCGLAEASTDCGVDVLSLGLNKNGGLLGEAVVLARPRDGFAVLQKGSLQLAAKTRFLAAQVTAQLEASRWRELAENANRMARTLADGIGWIDGAGLGQPVGANIVFVRLPLVAARHLADHSPEPRPLLFPAGEEGLVRLVTSWNTGVEDVDAVLTRIADALA